MSMRFERDERKFDFHDIGREIKRKREASGCKSRIDVMLSSMDEKDLRLVETIIRAIKEAKETVEVGKRGLRFFALFLGLHKTASRGAVAQG